MSARRPKFLGYVVGILCADGTRAYGRWVGSGTEDAHVAFEDANQRHAALFEVDYLHEGIGFARECLGKGDALFVEPRFAEPKKPRTPKPQPAAPVEAEGWYALMYEGDTFLGIGVRGSEVSSRENAVRGKKLRGGEGEIVRILPDGAHEAAIAKAREEGAAAALHDARRTLLDLADDFTGDHAQGLRHAVRVIHDKIKAAKEAGKVGG